MIVGHTHARAALEQQLPPVVLLLGPASVGKTTLTDHLAAHHQVQPADRLRLTGPLLIDTVRDIIRFVATAPFGTIKLVQARLDAATVPAQHALLKILEEPPGTARFLLTAHSPPLPTIMSRCQILHCGLLTDAEVAQVLAAGTGLTRKAATDAAGLHLGRIRPTLDALRLSKDRDLVRALVQAMAGFDVEQFDRTCKQWGEDSHALFVTWAAETLSHRHRMFTPQDRCGITDATITAMLKALTRTAGARPRLAVRTALLPFLRR